MKVFRQVKSLEETIRPSASAASWRREVIGSALVILLTAILIKTGKVSEQRYFTDVVGQMFSFYLLLSIGFALALRHGVIDMSIWATASLGGVLAAVVIRAGGGWVSAVVVAMIAGSLIGAGQGFVIRRLRAPGVIVTLLTGAAIVIILRAIYAPQEHLLIPDQGLDAWQRRLDLPPFAFRMLLVAGAYGATFLILAVLAQLPAGSKSSRLKAQATITSLWASGALGALGGAIWVIDHGMAPIPRQVIGDLRVPVAALLAGALFFCGGGRVMLTLLCLPATVLATTLWRLNVANLPFGGHSAGMILLGAMVLAVHGAASYFTAHPRRSNLLQTGGLLLTAAMLLLAATGITDDYAILRLLYLLVACVWGVGAVLFFVSLILRRRQSVQGGGNVASEESADLTTETPGNEDTRR